MDFGLSSEQIGLQDSVRRYLAEHAELERVRSYVKTPDYAQLWQGLVELGVPALIVPERLGGVGLECLDVALVAECLGAAVTPAPFLGTAVLLPLALVEAPDTVRGATLERLSSGQHTAGVAFSELAGARGQAGVTASGQNLSGLAQFVFDPLADLLLVASKDRALYLVEGDAPGLRRRALTTIDRTRQSGELAFDNTPALLLNDDPAVSRRLLDIARVMLVADTLGAAQHMLDSAVEYAKQRRQFGRVIGSFQAVKHLCAEMAAALEPCRAMMWYAAHTASHLPQELSLTAAHSKAHVAEVGTFVARTATEVHGGVGFTDLLGLHYWFKRIGYNRQALGSPEWLRNEAASLQGW